MNRHRRATTRRHVMLTVVATVLLLVWVFPLLWAIVVSLKSENEVLAYPPSVLFEPIGQNYEDALFGDFSIASSLLTSTIVSLATTVLTIVLAVPAAYAFARLKLPAKKSLGFYTLATQMVPPVGLVIPYFLILNRLSWLDTYQGMVAVYLTFSLPFAIWLMVSYMEDIPLEMEEAAFLDKASRLQTLWHIIIPQVRGGIAVCQRSPCVAGAEIPSSTRIASRARTSAAGILRTAGRSLMLWATSKVSSSVRR